MAVGLAGEQWKEGTLELLHTSPVPPPGNLAGCGGRGKGTLLILQGVGGDNRTGIFIPLTL